MKLTQFTDYSLRVLIYLAAQPDRRATIAEIASAFQVSESHLTKVAHLLGQNGWLANVRGKGGGLELAMAPEDINIGQVVRETEGTPPPVECVAGKSGPCRIAPVCELRGILTEAMDAFYAVLDGHSLASVAHNGKALSRLLFIDRPTTRLS